MKTLFTPIRSGSKRKGAIPALLAVMLLVLGLSTSSFAQNLLATGFEGSSFPPASWTVTTNNTTYPWTRTTSGYIPSTSPHSGSYMGYYNSWYASSGSVSELISPVINMSTYAGLNQLTFWMYRYSYSTNDKIDVYVNSTNSATGGTLLATIQQGVAHPASTPNTMSSWNLFTFNLPATWSSATTYIIFKATSAYGVDMLIDDISLDHIGPCTGVPSTPALTPSGTQTVCPGTVVAITTTNAALATGINFQWMQSTNGGTTWVPAVGGTGATTKNYTTGAITSNIRYRLHTYCATGDSSVSAAVIFNVTAGPVYASLPFSEGFENWTSRCGTSDIPSTSWTNIPFTGNNSFRRDDQGSTASWTSPTSGGYTPIAKEGVHSARFHAYYANSGSQSTAGQLSMYIDCSAVAGVKELQFWSRLDPGASYPQDSIIVDTSTNGGATFGVLRKIGPGTGGWTFTSVNFLSNSPTTVIRFRAWQNYNCTGCGYPDILLDGVKVLPPCAGKPTAGTINPVTPCPSQNFTLSLTGTTPSAGLGYTWEFMPQGGSVWTALAGGNVASPTANITVPTYFRVTVACTNGGPTDTSISAPILATLAPFYQCYCAGYFGGPSYWTYPYVNISNVTIRTQPANVVLLNNGNPIPITNNPNYPPNGYTNYRSVPAPTLIRDSTYKLLVSESSYTSWVYNGYVAAWIDFDRDGVFSNTGGERVMVNQAVLSSASPITSINFTVPSGANIGLTGMRIAMNYTSLANPSPCGQIQPYYGEVEDYLVYIDYPPCTGPVNAGTAWISDTAVCPGYSIDLGDTTYEKQRTNITRMWQYTNNGGAIWFNIPGSANKDTVNNVLVTGASMYRLRAVCTKTGDTTYSNVLSVSIPDPVRCYPYSQAMGGFANDSTDIGAVVIGSIVNPVAGAAAGPHLNNPLAVRRRTDYTLLQGIELYADSTYRLSVFQTMPRGIHSDAMVSVFMDFNNDLQYNVGSATPPFTDERVFQGITHFDSFYLDTKIKIPSAVIPNVPTGMRVVINSDLNPNAAGNSGIGGFVSGEVEDYVIMFRRAGLGVKPGAGILQNLSLYPNPTEGKFTVLCDAGSTVKHLDVVVSTITGQQVITRSFDNVGVHFTTDLDLSREAKGIYFVEVRADGEKITRKLIVR